jgi:hypothetical protein
METAEGASAAQVAERARQRGAQPHLVDGRVLVSKRAALDAIAAALSFPDWFGHNLDALHDSLTDLSWLPAGEHVLVWSHPEVLRARDPGGYAGVSDALRDAVTAGGGPDRPLRVVLTAS